MSVLMKGVSMPNNCSECYFEDDTYCFVINDIVESCDRHPKCPLVEVPTPQKGKWIRHNEVKNIYGGIYIECSECGEKYVVQYIDDEKYCRNCGADMRGDNDE